MPTMIRPRQTVAANNAPPTPKKARSLSGSSLLGHIGQLDEKNGRLTPPATTASGVPVPRIAPKQAGVGRTATPVKLRGEAGCWGAAQRQQKTRFVRTA